MKCGNSSDIIHKDVVVVGNGPSGLAISYMLSGNLPYIVSNDHPDELLSARLSMVTDQSLVKQELGYLASGLEGRSTNPISLLLDALTHPYADVGLELDSLVEWRKDGAEIDHVVLGSGPPGGSWHKMDPYILTLSLGTWMALPGLPYSGRDGSEKRASAGNVARYYVQYMNEMGLKKYFQNGVCVINVKEIKETISEQPDSVDNLFGERCSPTVQQNTTKLIEQVENDIPERMTICSTPERGENLQKEQRRQRVCSLSNALNFIRLRSTRKCKRRRDALLKNELSPDRKIREILKYPTCSSKDNEFVKLIPASYSQNENDHSSNVVNSSIFSTELCTGLCRGSNLCRNNARSISFSCDYDSFQSSCDSLCSKSFKEQGSFINSLRNSIDFENSITKVPKILSKCDMNSDLIRLNDNCDQSTSVVSNQKSQTKWLIETYDAVNDKYVTYICKNLILANGASDLPNKLAISNERNDPKWLVHDVRTLELELDRYLSENTNDSDPVLVVGAGLSAADAIIATRCRNVPVLHVFRNKNSDFGKQLPENMYPEYHKVHQMMQDGGSSYPLYRALPECSLTEFNEKDRTVTLTTKNDEELKFHISFAAVLIGALPDLGFLPQNCNLGLNKQAPVDNKTNNVDINKLTHSVNGFDGLYAMGPLAGDNFVRFIPGGALAIVSDLYRKNKIQT